MNISKPVVVDLGLEKRLDVSHVKAVAYIVQEEGPVSTRRVAERFVELFPEVAVPKANWQTVLSQAAHQGLVRKAARGVYASPQHDIFS